MKKMKKYLFVILTVLCFYTIAEDKLTVPVCSQAPLIDGIINDECWKNATEVNELFIFKEDKKTKDTRFRICFDNEFLYISVEADNDQMRLLNVRAQNDGNEVFHDDSVEVYIGSGKRYRHLALNFINSRYSTLNTTITPFLWLSATRRNLKGWTAEIAIPLYSFRQAGRIPRLSFNLLRTKQSADIDAAGVPEGFHNTHRSLANLKDPHDYGQFVELRNIEGLQPKQVSIPQLLKAEVRSYQTENGKPFYPLELILDVNSPKSRKVKVLVEESLVSGTKQKVTQQIELDDQKCIELKIPVKDYSARDITVSLLDPLSNVCFSKMQAGNCKSLKTIEPPVTDRNYYTDEKEVRLKLKFNIPDNLLKKYSVKVFLTGRVLLEKKEVRPVNILSFPLSDFEVKDNNLEILITQNGNTAVKQNVTVRRLLTNPDCEVKVDQFNLVLLKNGKPFFPFCALVLGAKGEDKELIKNYAASGFNALERCEFPENQKHDVDDLKKWLENSSHYKIYTINKPTEISHRRLFGIEKYKLYTSVEKSFIHNNKEEIKVAKSLLTRNFSNFRPSLQKVCGILKNSPWFLMHMIGDEPNQSPTKLYMFVSELIGNVVRKEDPYHPTVAVFSRKLPEQKELAKKLYDIYAYDVYSSPGYSDLYNQPGLAMAYYTYQLKKEADANGKVAFMMPMLGGMGCGKANNQTPEEMKCIAYVGLIYGTKGILYFGQYLEVPPVHWSATKTIADELKIITPAVLSPELKQEIIYKQTYKPEQTVFPPVNVKAFQHPDGRIFLLTVNLLPKTYNTTIGIAGLKNAKMLFPKDSSEKINNSVISTQFLPYETKAYELILSPTELPLTVKVDSILDNAGPVETVEDIGTIIGYIQSGKNYVFNPTFRLTRGRGLFPTFWHPRISQMFNIGQPGSGWYLDKENLWNGIPSLKISNKKARLNYRNVKATDGKVFLPTSEKTHKYTVSFYAKADTEGKKVRLYCAPNASIFNLTTDWKRYQAVWDLKYNRYGDSFYIYALDKGMTMWINGIQVEKGNQATEFSDDTIKAVK